MTRDRRHTPSHLRRNAGTLILVLSLLGFQFFVLRVFLYTDDPQDQLLTLTTVSVDDESTGRRRNDDSTWDDRIPRRLITVFGLESSGTTFVYDTIQKAMNLPNKVGEESFNFNRSVVVQHMSLPSGDYFLSFQEKEMLEEKDHPPVVPFAVPEKCKSFVGRPTKVILPPKHQCAPYASEFVLETERKHPSRYFINITSHLQWYRAQGTRITAVLVVRDPSMHFYGVLQSHCRNATLAHEQYLQGRSIMQHAMATEANRRTTSKHVNHDSPSLVVVSYETLMTLQNEYLGQIFRQLGIENPTTWPHYKNGNAKYLQLPDEIQRHLNQTSSQKDGHDHHDHNIGRAQGLHKFQIGRVGA